MAILHAILDVLLIPLSLIALLFVTPVLLYVRFFHWTWKLFYPEDLRSKVIVITGASSGIGEHIAYEYGKRGARLALTALREEELRKVAQKARELGARDVIAIPADISHESECKKIIDETLQRYQRLDHLVNNAGIAQVYSVEEASKAADFRLMDMMNVNFWGTVQTTFHALPHLKKSHGRIIVVSSVAAFLPSPRMAIYNASKAALFNFFDTLRVELGVQVNITIVIPGVIESELLAGKFSNLEGKVVVNKELRNIHFGTVPVEPASSCAYSIVEAARHDRRYLITPLWYSTAIFGRFFVPELLERFLRWGISRTEGKRPLTKGMMDMTLTERTLYPKSIWSK